MPKKVKYTKKELKTISEPWHKPNTDLGDAVFGIEDGLVETLGITIGVASAGVGIGIVILAGVAAMFSGGMSMCAGSYLSTKTENELYCRTLKQEKEEIQKTPKTETEEVRKIYYKRGFRGKLLEQVVKKITSNKKIWLQVMMEEEHGLHRENQNNPIKAGVFSGGSYIIGAAIPIIPYLLSNNIAMRASFILTALALFIFGAWKGKYTKLNPWKKGTEMLIVGLLAFAVGTLVGKLLGQ